MAFILNILDDLERESYNPLYDFGFGIQPSVIHALTPAQPPRSRYAELLQHLSEQELLARRQRGRNAVAAAAGGRQNQVSTVGKDGFQVCMDVAQFKPNELSVKVVDNYVVIEGKHEEREDNHGFISRQFVRRYAVPSGYDAAKVASTLSSDGVLTVSIPKPQPIEDKSKERVVQIQQTGPAHLNVKQNDQENKGEAIANGNKAQGDK